MNKIVSLCLLLFIMIFTQTAAQTNFVAARIVMISGDTVSGFVDNRDWLVNPKSIAFKTVDGQITTYSPTEIRSFNLINTQEWYDGATTTVDKSSIRDADVISQMGQRGPEEEKVFLRLLIRGRLTLYILNDENDRIHYLISKNGTIEELRIEKRLVTKPQQGIVVIEHFKGQLSDLVADCRQARVEPMRTEYNRKSLSELVRAYNLCFGETSYVATNRTTQVAFGILAGVNNSTMSLDGLAYTRRYEGKYGPDIVPVGGIFLELIGPRARGSWSLYNELIYSSYSFEELFAATQLKLFTGVRYRFPVKGKIRPYVGGFMSNTFSISSEINVCQSCAKGFRTYEQGFAIDGGVMIGKLRLGPRFEETNGFSPYASTKARIRYHCFTAAFVLR